MFLPSVLLVLFIIHELITVCQLPRGMGSLADVSKTLGRQDRQTHRRSMQQKFSMTAGFGQKFAQRILYRGCLLGLGNSIFLVSA